MTIDNKPMVPKIPEPPLGVSREILGDPCGGDGGGGGQRMLGAQQGERRRCRSNTARRQMRDGSGRGSRSNSARRRMEAQQGGQRGKSRRRPERRDREIEGRTRHARNAAEEPEVYRRNPRDGTWRRSGGMPQAGSVSSAQCGLWRPLVAEEEEEVTLQTIVSIADPTDYNYPNHFASTDIRTRSHLQRGK